MTRTERRSRADLIIGFAAIAVLVLWWVIVVSMTAVEPVDWPAGTHATPVVAERDEP